MTEEEGTLLLLPTEDASDDRSFMALKLNDPGTGCSAMVHIAFVFSRLLTPRFSIPISFVRSPDRDRAKCPTIARTGWWT